MFFPALLSLALFSQQLLCQLNNSTTPNLNVTAISAANGESTLECWQLGPFQSSTTPGTAGALALFLGSISNATYSVVPARFDGGLHNAPAKQLVTAGRALLPSLTNNSRFVVFTAGLAHITLPSGSAEAWVHGGKYGFIIAADTVDVSAKGHRTEYPSGADTVALQIPFGSGTSFNQTVLHNGPCTEIDMIGI